MDMIEEYWNNEYYVYSSIVMDYSIVIVEYWNTSLFLGDPGRDQR